MLVSRMLVRRRVACRRLGARLISTPGAPAPTTDKVLHPPDPPSASHLSLATFQQYAARVGMNPTSTVYVGTHYEYMVQESLSRYGFSLRRVGGVSDNGIDLLGTWTVPSSAAPLKVLLQCKALSRKASPQLIRELEGAFVGAPTGWRGRNVIGFLVTQQPASKGVRDALGRSRWPMAFVSCSPSGQIQQLLWNPPAAEEGLMNMGAALQHGADSTSQMVLTFKGKPLPLGKSTAEGDAASAEPT